MQAAETDGGLGLKVFPDLLIRQGVIAPLAMALPLILGFFVADYNSLSQHMSELQLRDPWIAWSVRAGAFIAGVSVCLFAIGCSVMHGKFRFSFTSLAAFAFGVGMISNGIFIIGSPLHGFYGLPIFLVLVPAFFVAEFHDIFPGKWFRDISLLTALLSLAYMWMLLVGFDPPEFRGLTQRAATMISFGWYALAAIVYQRRGA